MFFDTPVYIVFLALVVAVYWRLGFRPQNMALLFASYVFYGWWDWRFLALMIASTTADFLIARKLSPATAHPYRRLLLITSVVGNFAVLGFFKYFDFFIDSAATALQAFGVENPPMTLLRILLPPGISFYTFQEIAYIVDVYDGKLEPAHDFVEYGLFISLFPHLIAGPIQRPSHLLPQVQTPRTFRPDAFYDGLMLIISGLFRKCVIADNCALIANAAFDGRLGEPSLPVVLLGMYAFAWQIYGDFSGYSDIARGSAQLLGFHFMVNFRQPYLAQNLQDFWRRWHISLSTWLRDYLYIRLGGNAHGERKTYRNLLLTMMLGGLWHGANWTFVVWGTIHGLWLALERALRTMLGITRDGERTGAVTIWVKRIGLFHLVALCWIFFRAPSLREAASFLAGVANWGGWQPDLLIALQVLVLFSLPLFLIDLYLEHTGEEYVLATRAPALRAAVGVALFIVIALASSNNLNAFIYFQF